MSGDVPASVSRFLAAGTPDAWLDEATGRIPELRHFEQYIGFAHSESGIDDPEVDARLDELKTLEAELITEPDTRFRFHSGVPEGP